MATYFEIRSDQVVLGQDPENADYCNPRGNVIGEAHFIIATAEDGSRMVHDARALTYRGMPCGIGMEYDGESGMSHVAEPKDGDVTVGRLERLAAHLNSTQAPLSPDHWIPVQPAYGSQAYVDGDWEAINAARERAEDAWAA